MKKRILSLIMALCMIATAMPVAVLADEPAAEPVEEPVTEAVEASAPEAVEDAAEDPAEEDAGSPEAIPDAVETDEGPAEGIEGFVEEVPAEETADEAGAIEDAADSVTGSNASVKADTALYTDATLTETIGTFTAPAVVRVVGGPKSADDETGVQAVPVSFVCDGSSHAGWICLDAITETIVPEQGESMPEAEGFEFAVAAAEVSEEENGPEFTLTADQESIAVGDTITYTYTITGADSYDTYVYYQIISNYGDGRSKTLTSDNALRDKSGSFTYTPDYGCTVKVTATVKCCQNRDIMYTLKGETDEVTVAGGSLYYIGLDLTAYVSDNKLTYSYNVTGGATPYMSESAFFRLWYSYETDEGTIEDYKEFQIDKGNEEFPLNGSGTKTLNIDRENVHYLRIDMEVKDSNDITAIETFEVVSISDSVIGSGTIDYINWTWYASGKLVIVGIGTVERQDAWDDCFQSAGLSELVIGEGITGIGENAFSGYYDEKPMDVSLPESLSSIGSCAFAGTHLSKIDLPSGLKSIGDGAFAQCYVEDKTLNIPDSVTSIGMFAFTDCYLTDITIGSGVKSIGEDAFSNNMITEINIPDGVTYIGEAAVYACLLQSITVENNPVYSVVDNCLIGNGVLIAGFSMGATVKIPKGITRIGEGAFNEWSGTEEEDYPQITVLEIPFGVTEIGACAFEACRNITTVTLPSTVKKIGEYAFGDCENLSDVYYGGSSEEDKNAIEIEADGEEASKITTAEWHYSSPSCGDDATWSLSGSGVLTISGSGAMTDYESGSDTPWSVYENDIKSVVICGEITTVGAYAFADVCPCLESVSILSDAVSIGEGAFENCESLASVYLPESMQTIDASAFSGCDNLTDVYFAGTETGKAAVQVVSPNTELKNATWHCGSDNAAATILGSGTDGDISWTWIMNGTLAITGSGEVAYQSEWDNCLNSSPLIRLVIGEGITSIANGAFSGIGGSYDESTEEVTNLEVSLPDSLISIGDGAFSDDPLETVDLPDRLETIGNHAFAGCTLGSVTIPESVQSVGESAFANNTITEIVISSGDTAIGEGAFVHCPLEDITVNGGNGQTYAKDNCLICGTTLIWGCADSKIPDEVTRIGNAAFMDRTDLTEIYIPYLVRSIGDYAFSGCENLKVVEFAGVNGYFGEDDIGDENNCLWSADITWDDIIYRSACGEAVTWGITSGGYLVISGTGDMDDYEYDEATGTGSSLPWAQYQAEYMAEHDGAEFHIQCVEIKEGVTSIGNFAFCGMDYGSVSIPASVTDIGEGAFRKAGLRYAVAEGNTVYRSENDCLLKGNVLLQGDQYYDYEELPYGVTEIAPYAFYGCYFGEYEYLEIPESVTEIPDHAFEKCSYARIVLPDTLTSIGDHAFAEFENLKLNIPDSVTHIGNMAFAGCGLETLVFPSGVTEFGDSVFKGCTKLTSVEISGGSTTIPAGIFENCTALESVTVPLSVTTIGASAFSGCSGLVKVIYAGTEKLWAEISIGDNNEAIRDAARQYSLPVDIAANENLNSNSTVKFENADTDLISRIVNEVIDNTAIYDLDADSILEATGNDYAKLKVDLTAVNVQSEESTAEQTAVEKITLVYEVHPIDTSNNNAVIENETIKENAKITFRLPIPSGTAATTAHVVHNMDDGTAVDLGNPSICGDDGNKYLEVTTGSFSDFTVTLETDHLIVSDPEDAATCTVVGKTAGSHCAICGQIIIERETIPALGHYYGEDGFCTRCGERKPYVAKRGDNGYYTLAAAVEAADPGDTITLINKCDEKVEVDKPLTIEVEYYYYFTGTVTGAKNVLETVGNNANTKVNYAVTSTIKGFKTIYTVDRARINKASLTIGEDLSLNYYCVLGDAYKDATMTFTRKGADNSEYSLTGVQGKFIDDASDKHYGLYEFVCSGITAQYMTANVSAELMNCIPSRGQ